ncbi:hypothetical protein METUNv1_00193 [Methyloversatilis universalis FAM5]|uniref:Uncharacterized protein n=1 Tax=Methyloversatilis universalis (strain ATCC BAA-1314 / DSM 25237 / JCM 13912 / CCUG 52030 / FAM5) TaxID=1000565 RepID=F5R788_METUF|nr:hypothetical protein METUNv1_00193 [Methyloversatilis universalis FAM5]
MCRAGRDRLAVPARAPDVRAACRGGGAARARRSPSAAGFPARRTTARTAPGLTPFRRDAVRPVPEHRAQAPITP